MTFYLRPEAHLAPMKQCAFSAKAFKNTMSRMHQCWSKLDRGST